MLFSTLETKVNVKSENSNNCGRYFSCGKLIL